MSAALVLVPSSKGKETGGRTPAYGDSGALTDHPLAEARSEVLAALEDAAERLDDHGMARLCGVDAEAAGDHRQRLASLRRAPTMAARHRYTGVVHANAGLAEAEPDGLDIGIIGGLLGVAWLEDPVPEYRLEVTGRVPDLGVLGTWWREPLVEHLRDRAEGCRVWDLLPGEHARMWPTRRRDGIEVAVVAFQRRDGRAAPSGSAKVAKGRLLRLLVEDPEITPEALVGDDRIEGWTIEPSEAGLAVVQQEA